MIRTLPARLDEARALDAADPLAWCRERFEFPHDASGNPHVYLNGNSLGLMPRAARTAVLEELDDWARLGVEGHFAARHPWYTYHEQFRESGARLVGARPGEVVMMNSLTVNLHLLMATFYRPTRDRFRILVEEGAFPSDVYAAAAQARHHGFDPDDALLVARPRPGEDLLRDEDLERLLAEQGRSIALVLLPGVQYYTGQWLDIGRLTAAAHAAGCVAGWDLAHAAGNVPLHLHEHDVDFAVWCSYKYLNAGPGAVAGCFVHERHGRDLDLPRLAGWWGNDPARRFHMDTERRFVPIAGAEGWQVSNPPVLALAPLRPALELFDEAGMQALRGKSLALTSFLEQLLDDVADAHGGRPFVSITPRDPAARGCQLSLRVARDGVALFERLTREGIVCDVRQPDVLRIAPVPLYNSYEDAWRLADAVARGLRG